MWIVSHIICWLVGVVYSVSNWLLWPYFYAKNVVVVDIRPLLHCLVLVFFPVCDRSTTIQIS